jgi:PAS domain S-box-containing protein
VGFAPFVEVNHIACQRYGYTYEEFLQLSAPEITKKSDANSHSTRNHRKQLLESGRLVFEAVHIKKSGEKFPVEINSNIFYEDGKPFILAVVRDITKRKRMETQALKIQQLETVATLSGGIAHEFNNALNIVSGNIELLQMTLPGHEKVRSFARQAMASIRRMSKLTNQFHAYARGGKYKAKSLNLNALVKSILPMISPELRSDIVINTDLSEDISSIRADATQLQMVLSAVLINSSEALEGGGSIHIHTCEKEIDETFAAAHPGITPGRYVTLTVKDNGCGMDEEIKNRIFDPFFTTKFQGRGLGMAAVYGIVKNHDGCVYVDSEPDNGTTVHIYFPREQGNE